MTEASSRPDGGVAPFLYDDLKGIADWHERLAWPVAMARMQALGDMTNRRALAFCAALDDELERQVAVVAAGRLVNAFMSLCEAAYVAQGEVRDGIVPFGGPPELDALRDSSAAIKVLADRYRGKGVLQVRPVSHALLRNIARTASWTAWPRLPIALLLPRATAISHNPLLRYYARITNERVNYQLAANIVLEARRRAPTERVGVGVRELPQRIVKTFLDEVEDLAEPWRQRLEALFVARTTPTVKQIAHDVLALRGHGAMPRLLWTGTNGANVNRLLSAEVRRRGGKVVGFNHGAHTAISMPIPGTVLSELCTTTAFCLGTESWANLLRRSGALSFARNLNKTEIIHADSEPIFRTACLDGAARAGRLRRVLYIGHPFRGLRQFAIAGTPDAIYWDLQSRVAAYLRELKIDFLCKPHPEGHFVDRNNPIEDIAPTSYQRFEEHLQDTDVFVFDAPTSTTFAEALCTNRPVVLIERGHYPFNPAIEADVRARCRIVQSDTDARNRIWPDLEFLAEAVLGGPETADPAFFRALFAGLSG